MPKYYEFKVCGYYLYYTASCVIEAMPVSYTHLDVYKRQERYQEIIWYQAEPYLKDPFFYFP